MPGEPPSYSHSFIVLSPNYLSEVLLVSYLFQEFSGFSLVNRKLVFHSMSILNLSPFPPWGPFILTVSDGDPDHCRFPSQPRTLIYHWLSWCSVPTVHGYPHPSGGFIRVHWQNEQLRAYLVCSFSHPTVPTPRPYAGRPGTRTRCDCW